MGIRKTLHMREIVYWIFKRQLLLFALLIFVAIFLWLRRFEKKLNLKWQEALLVALGHVIIGWSCMRLMAYLEVGFDFEKAASMRIYGMIFALPVLYYVWAKRTKRNTALVLDVAAICVIFGCISGRLNCLTGNCCRGVLIHEGGELRWPIRELELVFYIVFLVIWCRKIYKGKTCGQVYPIYLITYGILRFICEWRREEFTTQIGILRLAHIWSLIAVAAGIIMYTTWKKNRRIGAKRQKIGRHESDKQGRKHK